MDRLVSRTVTYALVTGLPVVPYLSVLSAVTRLAGDAGSLAVAAAQWKARTEDRGTRPPRPRPAT